MSGSEKERVGAGMPGPGDYRDLTVINLLGRDVCVLDISREVSSEMPVYPGHVSVNFWDHLTHEQVKRQRLPKDSPFWGYAVRGLVASEHVSTHVDAVWHFNPNRPDLTIERVPFEHLITPAAWIDLSHVAPRTHITVADIRAALDQDQIELKPGMTLLYRTGWDEKWHDPFAFVEGYPGLDKEASEWVLDQGIINLCTDAPSTDHPGDPNYPNHSVHGERCVIHTEMIANMDRIPMHDNFWVMFFPLKLVGGTGSPARAVALWEA